MTSPQGRYLLYSCYLGGTHFMMIWILWQGYWCPVSGHYDPGLCCVVQQLSYPSNKDKHTDGALCLWSLWNVPCILSHHIGWCTYPVPCSKVIIRRLKET
jgi:hypothetical protein